MRGNMIQIELMLWNDVLHFAPPDSPIAREAKPQIAKVHRMGTG